MKSLSEGISNLGIVAKDVGQRITEIKTRVIEDLRRGMLVNQENDTTVKIGRMLESVSKLFVPKFVREIIKDETTNAIWGDVFWDHFQNKIGKVEPCKDCYMVKGPFNLQGEGYTEKEALDALKTKLNSFCMKILSGEKSVPDVWKIKAELCQLTEKGVGQN